MFRICKKFGSPRYGIDDSGFSGRHLRGVSVGIALGPFCPAGVCAAAVFAIAWSWCLFSLGMYLAAPFYLDVESGLFFQPFV